VADPSVPEAFDPDDRVALFCVSMAMAANDVEYAIRQAVAANPEGANDEDRMRSRFSQKVRLTNGFLFEGVHALKRWRQHEPAVAALLRELPAESAKELSMVCSLEQKIGPKTLSGVRQHTFHYPHPDPGKVPDSTETLAAVIESADDVPLRVNIGDRREHTFLFADPIAAGMALSEHDSEKLLEVQGAIRDGAIAFVQIARAIFLAFCEQRGYELEVSDSASASEPAP
jgi:hypothetical protein